MEVKDFDSFQTFLRKNNVFRKFGVDRIGVFGSIVRGEKFHDIDLLMDQSLTYKERKALKQFLESKLHVPVDIVIKKFAEPIILHRAIKDIKYAVSTGE